MYGTWPLPHFQPGFSVDSSFKFLHIYSSFVLWTFLFNIFMYIYLPLFNSSLRLEYQRLDAGCMQVKGNLHV